jgi:ATP adenylyltransferase
MITPSPKNPHSHLTVKERQAPSFPTRHLLAQGLIQGRVLDFGCGTGTDVNFLRQRGIDITGYDPYYAPTVPTGRFDTILCHYVLNVLLPEEQAQVLMAVAELLKPSGRAYFTVRRDIQRAGFRRHTEHEGVKVYQCNVVLPFRSVLTAAHCEIYEYRHYTQLPHTAAPACPYCQPSPTWELLTETATVYAVLDANPAAPGHVLVIPKLHVASYFDLPEKVRTACWLVVERVCGVLKARVGVEGGRVCVDVGAAGQTVSHTQFQILQHRAECRR